MRSRLSTLMLTLVASALVASLASAAPIIRFGQGPKLPSECDSIGIDLDCVAPVTTQLNFSLIIEIDSDGIAGASFSAEWDGQLQNALGSASGGVGNQTSIEVDPGPPPVNVAYTPAFGGGTGVVDSTPTSAGGAQSWSMSGLPDPAVNILNAGLSWRAGTLSVTVDSTVGTRINLGFFQGGGWDVFLAASGTQLAPNFGYANINAVPEPGITLLMGLGLLGLTLAGRSSRK